MILGMSGKPSPTGFTEVFICIFKHIILRKVFGHGESLQVDIQIRLHKPIGL